MSSCAPLEDYEYIIFGSDRCFIVAIEFILYIGWLVLLFRIDPSILKLWMLTITAPIFLLTPIRLAKTIHTTVDPENVEDTWVYCWYLRLEFSFHYWLSNTFLSATIALLFLILKRHSNVFPVETIHRRVFGALLVEALLRSVVAEFADSLLGYWPSLYHIWLQIVLTCFFFLLLILLPCWTKRRQKEGRSGWSLSWLHGYLVIPFLLNLTQCLLQAILLFPRHNVRGYEATTEEQDGFWYSIESYISHKFSFTVIFTLFPMLLLPPVRTACWRREHDGRAYSSGSTK